MAQQRRPARLEEVLVLLGAVRQVAADDLLRKLAAQHCLHGRNLLAVGQVLVHRVLRRHIICESPSSETDTLLQSAPAQHRLHELHPFSHGQVLESEFVHSHAVCNMPSTQARACRRVKNS